MTRSYRDAPNPGPLFGYPGLPFEPLAYRAELYTPRNPYSWSDDLPFEEGAQPPFPSDLPAPLYVPPTFIAGAHRISSPYGPRIHPTHGGMRMHHGIDIAVPVGTPVYPVGPAVVEAVKIGVEPAKGGPAIVTLRTPADGYRWSYMHLSAVLVAPGMTVSPNQPIGLTGSAGTGPHLHFVAYDPDGHTVDPVSLFPPGTFRR